MESSPSPFLVQDEADIAWPIVGLLTPSNQAACRAFSGVVDFLLLHSQNEGLRRHQSHIVLHNRSKLPLRSLLAAQPASNIASPSTSFSSQATQIDDPSDDPMANELWSGSYVFSIQSPPRIPQVGWIAGYGPILVRDTPSNLPELLLSAGTSARDHVGLHSKHAAFNFDKLLATFACKALRNSDAHVRIASQQVSRDSGFQILVCDQVLSFAGLDYRFRFTPDANSDITRNSVKSYIATQIDASAVVSSGAATPSEHDIIIAGWRLLNGVKKGATAAVIAAVHIKDNTRAAAKKLQIKPSDETARIARLITMRQALHNLHHDSNSQYISTLREVIANPHNSNEKYYIFVPFVSADLEDYIRMWKASPTRPPHDDLVLIFAQLMQGLTALHAAGFLHGDLKPLNLGLVKVSPPQLAILDIDDVQDIREATDKNSCVACTPGYLGTPGFLAPERECEGGKYGLPSDIWAAGCVGLRLFDDQHLHKPLNPYRTPSRLSDAAITSEKADYQRVLASLKDRSDGGNSVYDLLASMLNLDWRRRPTASQALDHPAMRRALERSLAGGKRKAR
ncbi:hypothetical protein AC578_1465 [Pseudocercospora eumusae]|uniref:non-specific serine/threonine protein kinase n=1 Tax=Pseudocercospora eumusae TaxID=321146 RepID=A0A139H6L4_9PEZI|nr:hypothetical protein AC578_1465 [Pseudocercospora eumusae]